MKTAWLYAYAKSLYLSLSSKPGMAVEYIEALTGGDIALQMFCEKFSDPCPDYKDDITEAAERAARDDSRKKGRA